MISEKTVLGLNEVEIRCRGSRSAFNRGHTINIFPPGVLRSKSCLGSKPPWIIGGISFRYVEVMPHLFHKHFDVLMIMFHLLETIESVSNILTRQSVTLTSGVPSRISHTSSSNISKIMVNISLGTYSIIIVSNKVSIFQSIVLCRLLQAAHYKVCSMFQNQTFRFRRKTFNEIYCFFSACSICPFHIFRAASSITIVKWCFYVYIYYGVKKITSR